MVPISVQLAYYTLRIRKKRKGPATMLDTEDEYGSMMTSPVNTQPSNRTGRDTDTPSDLESTAPIFAGDFVVGGGVEEHDHYKRAFRRPAYEHEQTGPHEQLIYAAPPSRTGSTTSSVQPKAKSQTKSQAKLPAHSEIESDFADHSGADHVHVHVQRGNGSVQQSDQRVESDSDSDGDDGDLLKADR